MGDYERNIQNAVAEVTTSAPVDLNVITLSTGVQLKKKKFSPFLIQSVISKFKYPPIPEYWDEDRKRGIKNPDHPEYIAQKAEVDEQRGMAAIDALIAFGTELSFIPDGFARPEEDEWADDLEAVTGISIRRDNYKSRYLAWVKNVAISDPNEIESIMLMAQTAAGVPGDGVAQAIDSFRD